MFGSSDGKGPSLLGSTLKSVLLIGGLSYLAANWLAAVPLDQSGLGRLASNIGRGVEDPITTGSLGGRANATRIDPCVAPKR